MRPLNRGPRGGEGADGHPLAADADLIATAPELIEALKAAATELQEISGDLGLNCWATVGPQIEAAIARAEGRES